VGRAECRVMMLSGAPITVDAWQPKLAERKGKLQVLVTHGTADAVLPFAASGWLRDLLVGSLCVLTRFYIGLRIRTLLLF
jgi:predicted esterase